jgi:hypothetical protein
MGLGSSVKVVMGEGSSVIAKINTNKIPKKTIVSGFMAVPPLVWRRV